MKRVFILFHRDKPGDIYIRLYGIFGTPGAAVSAQEAHEPEAGKLEIVQFLVQEGMHHEPKLS